MSEGVAINDPDDWLNRWKSLHHSDLFHGEFLQLALAKLSDPLFEEGTGREVLRYTDQGEDFEVDVKYALEYYPNKGRVFQVLSILSKGDPIPPSTGS